MDVLVRDVHPKRVGLDVHRAEIADEQGAGLSDENGPDVDEREALVNVRVRTRQ